MLDRQSASDNKGQVTGALPKPATTNADSVPPQPRPIPKCRSRFIAKSLTSGNRLVNLQLTQQSSGRLRSWTHGGRLGVATGHECAPIGANSITTSWRRWPKRLQDAEASTRSLGHKGRCAVHRIGEETGDADGEHPVGTANSIGWIRGGEGCALYCTLEILPAGPPQLTIIRQKSTCCRLASTMRSFMVARRQTPAMHSRVVGRSHGG